MAITGEEDVITDGNEVRIITGGDVLLTKVTGRVPADLGAGCLCRRSKPAACRYGGPGLLRAAAARAAERTADQGPEASRLLSWMSWQSFIQARWRAMPLSGKRKRPLQVAHDEQVSRSSALTIAGLTAAAVPAFKPI